MSVINQTANHQELPLILVADDDRTMRRLLRHAMQKEGYQVVEASDGDQCLANRVVCSIRSILALLAAIDFSSIVSILTRRAPLSINHNLSPVARVTSLLFYNSFLA